MEKNNLSQDAKELKQVQEKIKNSKLRLLAEDFIFSREEYYKAAVTLGVIAGVVQNISSDGSFEEGLVKAGIGAAGGALTMFLAEKFVSHANQKKNGELFRREKELDRKVNPSDYIDTDPYDCHRRQY
jgi:hypothetical protein